jgi:hypothetical protein
VGDWHGMYRNYEFAQATIVPFSQVSVQQDIQIDC